MRFVRRDKEKKAEKAVNAWYDVTVPHMRTKLNLQGRRGWPDQCYWLPGGPLLIEFKTEDEEPRKLQLHIHKRLRDDGYQIETHTDPTAAIASIRRRLAPGTVPAGRSEVLAGKSGRRSILATRAKEDKHYPRSGQDIDSSEEDSPRVGRRATARVQVSVAKRGRKVE